MGKVLNMAVEQAGKITKETGISVGLLLAIIVPSMGILGTVIGSWVHLSIRMTIMENQMVLMRTEQMNLIANQKADMDVRFAAIQAEMDRRTASRWSEVRMHLLQQANQEAFNSAGITVKLPDPFQIKEIIKP